MYVAKIPGPTTVVLPLIVPGHRVLANTMMLSLSKNHVITKITKDDFEDTDQMGIESSNRPSITYPRAGRSF